MRGYIPEVELNFSNVCAANCIFCSRPHGVGNSLFMERDVFDVLLSQLKEIKIDMIQTSGNGETFLNPNYLDYVEELRDALPGIPTWIYNNFSMMTKQRADRIIKGRLFDKINTRVDGMQKWSFEKCSNLNQENVFKNIEYFISQNDCIPFVILYNNVKDYYARCQRVLGKRPIRDYFSDEELSRVTDDMNAIRDYFIPKAKREDLMIFCKINHCLWGERSQAPKNETAPCPKINVLKKVIWVCPNGDCSVCCYDDTQSHFVAGNILEEHIMDIFNGEKRKEFIRRFETRFYKDYPCINPRCCSFGDGIEAK